MRFIRSGMRSRRQPGLSVPQFRALVFVHLNEDASLSALAEQVGLSLPAASRMVEQLVHRNLMERRTRANDRRCVCLSLTRRGTTVFRTALRATQSAIAQRFRILSTEELNTVDEAMQILNRLFSSLNGQARATKPAALAGSGART